MTHGALQTLFVPRGIVDSHQEAVGDGPLASFTHGSVVTVRACGVAEEMGQRQRGEAHNHIMLPGILMNLKNIYIYYCVLSTFLRKIPHINLPVLLYKPDFKCSLILYNIM